LIEEYEVNNPNMPAAAYVQGPHGAIKSLVNNVYYYQDEFAPANPSCGGLGSTSYIADSNGNLLESYHYDLYGTPSYFDSASHPLNSSTVAIHVSRAGTLPSGRSGWIQRGRQ
jgi:hypothetical protein